MHWTQRIKENNKELREENRRLSEELRRTKYPRWVPQFLGWEWCFLNSVNVNWKANVAVIFDNIPRVVADMGEGDKLLLLRKPKGD